MNIYGKLGVPSVINAATTLTAIGGTLMPDEVRRAMDEAARSFVDMHELHAAAGKHLAKLTRNEAAYVTSGCAAGLVLGILGARNGGDPAMITEYPGHPEAPYEVIMHTSHRIPYDPAVGLAGAIIRQIGNNKQTFDWELESAISDNTAAVLYVANDTLPGSALALERVVAIAHKHQVPVIVDAAAQLPPMDNLWRFTRDLGADAAVFSGGKNLRGPQASGLMVGSSAFIEAARQNGSPHQRWARALKAGKEEIAGLVAAVERFLTLDHDGTNRDSLRVVEAWHAAFTDRQGISAVIEPTNSAGQPLPRLRIAIDDPERAANVLTSLENSTPRVVVLPHTHNGQARGFWITPELLSGDEAELVHAAVDAALRSA